MPRRPSRRWPRRIACRQRQREHAGEIARRGATARARRWSPSSEREQARLQGIDRAAALERHAAEAGERVETSRTSGPAASQGPGPAAHRHRADDRRAAIIDQAERDDAARAQVVRPRRAAARSSRRRASAWARVEAQRAGERVLQPGGDSGAATTRSAAAGGDRREVAEVARARDLPFRARLVELARATREGSCPGRRCRPWCDLLRTIVSTQGGKLECG